MRHLVARRWMLLVEQKDVALEMFGPAGAVATINHHPIIRGQSPAERV
jgi:hypothetical protein